jgi:hypothetical protein
MKKEEEATLLCVCAHRILCEVSREGERLPRGCYELAQESLANAENGGSPGN